MATYFLFGKYGHQGLSGISSERTEKAREIIKEAGGQLKDAYALLGEHDVVLIADLPSTEAAVKASLGLAKLTGISFETAPAIPIEEFDRIAG